MNTLTAGGYPPTATTGIHIPLYRTPDEDGLPVWEAYRDVKLAYPNVPMFICFNPSNGDGWSTPDPLFVSAIQMMKDAGFLVLGYTYTLFTARPTGDVQARIDAYKTCYPNIDGIMFDEMDNDADDVTYYTTLKDYCHTQFPGSLAVGNPGTAVNEALVGAMDMIKVQEGAGYSTAAQISTRTFNGQYNKSNFGWTAHTVSEFDSKLVTATCNMVKWIFITNDGGANPYDEFSNFVRPLASTLSSLAIAGVID